MRLMTSTAALFLLAASAGGAGAQSSALQSASISSDWNKVYSSQVRIISGDTDLPRQGEAYAGLQLKLDKGWKTYWRSPGDAGVPPTFDWSGSENLERAEVLFPAPKKYADEYTTSIGYKHEVVLPVRIIARDPSKPVKVKLNFGYGLCEKICISGETKLRLTLQTKQFGFGALLADYQQKVPQRVDKTGELVQGYRIDKVEVKLEGAKPHIAIDATVPGDQKKAELFVEAPDGIYLPFPKKQKPARDGRLRFKIDLARGDDPASLKGRTLALTLVGGDNGIEYHHKVN